MTRLSAQWMLMRPLCGIWPSSERTSDVLPPPLAPTMQWIVAARTVNVTSSRIDVAPSVRLTRSNSIVGPFMSLGAGAGLLDGGRERRQVLAHLFDELRRRVLAAADMGDRVHLHARRVADRVRQLAREVLLGEQHVDVRGLDAIDRLGELARRRLDAVARLDDGRHLKPELLQDVVVARVHRRATEVREAHALDLRVELAAQLANLERVTARVLAEVHGVLGIELAQFLRDRVDLLNRR